MADLEDPYAVSSDSDDEALNKPPPKIHIEGRADINQLKSALTEPKGIVKDDARAEELEQLKQANELKRMKQEFEEGKLPSTAAEELQHAKAAIAEERQKLTEIGKEKYSKFKNRFENLDSTLEENLEEKLKRMEKDTIGLGKETLASAKESQDEAVNRREDSFLILQDMTADDAPKDCAVCGKTVYPVERIFANKQLYHNHCFKCSKCEKKLTPTNYNSHQGALLCKVHMLEVFHPEIAKTMDPANTEAGTSAVQDELAQITSLKSKKGDFESSVKEAAHVERLTKVSVFAFFFEGVFLTYFYVLEIRAAEARKSFMQGSAFETAAIERSAKDLEELQFKQLQGFKERFERGEGDVDIQKTTVDLVGDVNLGGIKAAFEHGDEEMSPEERAALKKKEIEAEFLRYKLARRAAAERAKQQAEEGNVSSVSPGEDAADVGLIKDRFDKGEAFKSHEVDERGVDVEIKMAGKAREKFMQIDASGAAPVLPNQTKKHEPSKWDKREDRPAAEIINRRVAEDNDEPEGDDAFDVKNLMNKFKQLGEASPASTTLSTEQRAELEAIKSEAKSLKKRFEQGIDDDSDLTEEKRRQMQEEFERLRKEREEAQRRLEEERAIEMQQEKGVEKDDVHIKAEHAAKMAAKWEKIQAKEAKKAERSRMPEKKPVTRFVMRPQPKCALCGTTVYRAEQFECFGVQYHVNCFRCTVCRQALRVERVHRNKDGSLYCHVHFKQIDNDIRCYLEKSCEQNNNMDTMIGERSQA
ncbi:hypothetical protein Angca_002267 [Angiostrongylus cantonensis]|nr:hypothetical protein Angca_002267 [Angiostrongylus cantonensis]